VTPRFLEFNIMSVIVGDLATTILEGYYAARQGRLGPFSPSFDQNAWLREGLGKALPEDGHLQVG
jgi:hypothetical protein